MATSRLERIGTIFTRKQTNDSLLKSLSEVLSTFEADHNALKDNEQKLEQLTGAFMKCIQQTTSAHKQKLKALKEIHSSFKKEVEGLLLRGAMKPDDRPLWYDVYRTFPPVVEPKFARPKVENTTIRPILYQEDVVRAKFHASGHGFAAINMQNQSGESQIKKLVQQYEKLRKEGVPESELIEKSALSLSNDRQQEVQNTISKGPETVTTQILTEAKIQNIFKE